MSHVRLEFVGRVSPVENEVYQCSKSVRNAGTSSTVFVTTEPRTRKKLGIGGII